MKRLLLVLAVAAGMLVLTPGTSWACSCVMSTPAQQVKRADTVVDAVIRWESTNGMERTYGVEVTGLFKGKAAVREKLVGPADEAACGLGDLATEKRYLFFVRGEHPGRMRVDLCGGSTPYDAALAAKVSAITGDPVAPSVAPPIGPGLSNDDLSTGTSFWPVLGSGAVVACVIGGLLWFRRKAS